MHPDAYEMSSFGLRGQTILVKALFSFLFSLPSVLAVLKLCFPCGTFSGLKDALIEESQFFGISHLAGDDFGGGGAAARARLRKLQLGLS